MPTYIPKPPRPDLANLASKLPEPFRKAGGAIGGLLDYAFPEDDPLGGLSPTPMVSIYKDAAGIPSKALRELGTSEFVESAKRLGSDSFDQAAGWFSSRYPRVAAHMRMKPEPPTGALEETAAAIEVPTFGRPKAPMDVGLTQLGRAMVDVDPAYGRDYLAHEGTHAAQALGNSHFAPLYNNAKEAFGYYRNPLEKGANLRGEAARAGLDRPESSHSSLRALQGLVEASGGSNPNVDVVRKILGRGGEPVASHPKVPSTPAPMGKPKEKWQPYTVDPEKKAVRQAKWGQYEAPRVKGLDELKTVGIKGEASKAAATLGQWQTTPGAQQRATNKLNPEKVREIRARFEAGEKLYRVAEDFGITEGYARQIINRENWTRVK